MIKQTATINKYKGCVYYEEKIENYITFCVGVGFYIDIFDCCIS